MAKEERYFRKGLGLKKEVEEDLRETYHNDLLEHLKAHDRRLRTGDLEIRLAKEFGFCYGVDRAVDYAYQARRRFPARRIWLTGEIIHNPHVNRQLLEMGIGFLSGSSADGTTFDDLGSEDVVIIPAFGVSVPEMEALRRSNAILVDTTCGSVLSVWKRVERYAREGYTAVIHGKYAHEETRATASRVGIHPGGRYLVVLDREQAALVCDAIEERADRDAFLGTFREASSPGFDPELHLERIGVANQTTMLSSESLEIAGMLRRSMERRFGEEAAEDRFLNFDTICSATQERQDAIIEMVDNDPPDLMVVVGGYNSSNTNHLAEIASQRVPTYHIHGPECVEGPRSLRYKPVGERDEAVASGWLPDGSVRVGITAGASTPNSKIGQVVERILACRGIDPREALV
jgi:4-hydroxy-3-methylbut-2-enyl diphosphate reductase